MENIQLINKNYSPDSDGVDFINNDGAKGTLKRTSMKVYYSSGYTWNELGKVSHTIGLSLPTIEVRNRVQSRTADELNKWERQLRKEQKWERIGKERARK